MKKYKIVAIFIAIVCLVTALTGCNPKHNELATIDNVKTITKDFTREQVIKLLGKPLAYDSEKKDWEKFGYDYMVYSPDDIEILNWYKGRSGKADNLPGFTSRLHWSNGNFERKYSTGVGKTDVAQISYIYISIKFENFKISIINCQQFSQGKAGSMPIHTETFLPVE